MSDTTVKLELIQRRIKQRKKLQEQIQEDKGALKQLLARLKKDLGFDSLEEAEEWTKTQRRAIEKLAQKRDHRLKKFETENAAKLEALGL